MKTEITYETVVELLEAMRKNPSWSIDLDNGTLQIYEKPEGLKTRLVKDHLTTVSVEDLAKGYLRGFNIPILGENLEQPATTI